MIEMGVSQAQAQFTKLFDKTVTIVDKKTNKKKAVILPYEEYKRLVAKSKKRDETSSTFAKFVGVLDKDFKSDDARYNEIVQ